MQRNPGNLTILFGKLFVFAYTWSYGGSFKRQDEMDDDGGKRDSKWNITEIKMYMNIQKIKCMFINSNKTLIESLNAVSYEYVAHCPWTVLFPIIFEYVCFE